MLTMMTIWMLIIDYGNNDRNTDKAHNYQQSQVSGTARVQMVAQMMMMMPIMMPMMMMIITAAIFQVTREYKWRQ